MSRIARPVGIALALLAATAAPFLASADVNSVMRTDDRYQCVRLSDGVVIRESARQDIVQAQCAVAVELSRVPHDVRQPTLHLAYVAPTSSQPAATSSIGPTAATSAPEATATAQLSVYANLTPICSDTGSVGMNFCRVPPTHFDFPVGSSIVKSDGVWRVFADLPAGANVLVCSTPQTPGAVADPYRDLCDYAARGDTYVPKSAVLIAPGQTLPAATGSASLSWTPPTANTDGSTLTDLAGYTVHYGAAADALTVSVRIADPMVRAVSIDNLPAGLWCFAIRAVNAAGTQSAKSNVACKTI